jgi:hypothetical protein
MRRDASMTFLNRPERVNELSGEVIRLFQHHKEGETWVHIGHPGLQ